MGIILKKGREKFVHLRHPWIFSGAIQSFPTPFDNGSVYPFYSAEKQLLGYAYFNRENSLCGRVVSFGEQAPEDGIEENILVAWEARQALYKAHETSCYRWIHAEGDFLPGLVVDRYGNYLVLQIGTLGMEKLKPLIINELNKFHPWKGIYEKSNSGSRAEESLAIQETLLQGNLPELIEIQEYGIKFLVNVKKGQKSGLFLDQKQMRQKVGSFASGKKVLNSFCYTGGFSLFAACHGALEVTSVDISEEAIALCKKNFLLNQQLLENHHFLCADVFHFLSAKEALPYDIVILDPPAFAKKREDVESAVRGYREINLQAMRKMPRNSLLLTCSCSYHIDENLFRKTVFEAAKKARVDIKIVASHDQSLDHPQNLFHREGEYLKGFLLQIGKRWAS